MEFHQLKCFREVAITQNCSQAAANLGMSRSSIRLNIKELENRLGTELFDSSNPSGPYEMTKCGKKLFEYASQILSLEAKAKNVTQEKTNQRQQKYVRICYNENLLHSFVPALFNSFYRDMYNTDIQLMFHMRHFQSEVLPMFEDGSADLAFTQ